ncbi:MAG: LuxR C-terminal-related transcriptional regulator [Gemmatimonadetes bacterium]|nr:LuxR C-terminal-related transcriptional regulator [Gemmatimonadota bacterium]
MTAKDRFDQVLEDLYKAALGDAEWVSAASLINDMIRTTAHSLAYVDVGPGGDSEVHMSRFFFGMERRVDLEESYYRDYYQRDEAIPRLSGLRVGELVYKSDVYTDREKKTSAAFNEFRCVNKTQRGLFMWIHARDGSHIFMSFGNSTERSGWGHDQLQAIRRLAPHICQFARVRRAMADARALGASLAGLLENQRWGIIQLDRRGRILEANDRARDVLLERDGLRDLGGVLAAGNHEEDVELQHLLMRALPPHGVQGAGGSMRITRRRGRAPLVLEIHPVRGTGDDELAWQVGALVLVVDPASRTPVDPELVASLLGLTPTESRVAVGLATGRTIPGIADTVGCAEQTVRTHLKRIYRKQGIRKQTELVRRVLSLEALRKSSS